MKSCLRILLTFFAILFIGMQQLEADSAPSFDSTGFALKAKSLEQESGQSAIIPLSILAVILFLIIAFYFSRSLHHPERHVIGTLVKRGNTLKLENLYLPILLNKEETPRRDAAFSKIDEIKADNGASGYLRSIDLRHLTILTTAALTRQEKISLSLTAAGRPINLCGVVRKCHPIRKRSAWNEVQINLLHPVQPDSLRISEIVSTLRNQTA